MTRTLVPASKAEFIAAYPADLCLDFANTRYWRGSETPTETLGEPDDLLRWCEQVHLVGKAGASAVRDWWRQRPLAAESAWREALALRETIYRLLFNCAEHRRPAAGDLAQLNLSLRHSPPRAALDANETGFGWTIARAFPPRVSDLLAPVLWSVGDLLVGRRTERLRHCANERCLWLFVDESKAGSRRWCSMSACGNRAKARRHYLRHKGG